MTRGPSPSACQVAGMWNCPPPRPSGSWPCACQGGRSRPLTALPWLCSSVYLAAPAPRGCGTNSVTMELPLRVLIISARAPGTLRKELYWVCVRVEGGEGTGGEGGSQPCRPGASDPRHGRLAASPAQRRCKLTAEAPYLPSGCRYSSRSPSPCCSRR